MSTVLEHTEASKDGKTVAVVTLNRPTQKNALSKELCILLAQTIQKLRDRGDVAALVLVGAGNCFSAGVDLKNPLFADASLMNKEWLDGPRNYMWQLQHCTFPTIAAVAGPCMTGGMEIALNCDILIASPSAVFRDTHSTFGIVPGGGMTQLLPRMVGLQRAKYASFSGLPINASTALAWGLVSEVVESDEKLLPRALALAHVIAGKSSEVNATIKMLQHRGQEYDVAGALNFELGFAVKAYTAMGQEGVKTQARLSKGFSERSRL